MKSMNFTEAWVLLATIALVGCVHTAIAAEQSTVQGYVDYVYDDDGNAVGATLTLADETIYGIVWDDRGRDMADDVYEEEADVTGELSEQDGTRWIRVVSYKRTVSTDGDSESEQDGLTQSFD